MFRKAMLKSLALFKMTWKLKISEGPNDLVFIYTHKGISY